jgi:phosphonate transport system substrate-binding protein
MYLHQMEHPYLESTDGKKKPGPSNTLLNKYQFHFLRYSHLPYFGNRDNIKMSMGRIIPAKLFNLREERKTMKKMYMFVSMMVVAVMLLTACGTAATPTAAPLPTATEAPAVPVLVPTATQAPVVVPTPNPLGTAAMPIVMAFAPSTSSTQLTTGGDALVAQLKTLTGYEFKVTVPTNYAALIEAMGSGNAQVGWLPPAAYVVAKSKGFADVAMVALRNGADHYAFQYIANEAQKFTVYYDPKTGKDTADAATALAQFAGKKPCYTDPLSASGYLVPSGFLAANKIKTAAGAWVQGHPTVVKSIYLSPKGEICAFGATYVPMADISKDFPDVASKVQTIWVSDPIIPNDTVAFGKDVPADVRQKLSDALVKISSTPDGLKLLAGVGYSWGGTKVVDDTFFDDFRVYLQSIKFDFNNFNG